MRVDWEMDVLGKWVFIDREDLHRRCRECGDKATVIYYYYIRSQVTSKKKMENRAFYCQHCAEELQRLRGTKRKKRYLS